MKKGIGMFTLFCIILFILSGCSSDSSVKISKKYNEAFSIRDGIQFGMSKDKIKEIEESTMASYETLYENYSGPFGTASDGDLYNTYHTMRVDRGVFGPSGTIYFFFDNDYQLIDMGYELDNNDYDYYLTSLKEQYGKPLDENVAKYLQGNDITPLIDRITLYNLPSSHTVYGNSVYWIVEYNDCDVLIELNDGINKVNRITGSYPVCFIGYKKTAKDALVQAINDGKEREKNRKRNEEQSLDKNL